MAGLTHFLQANHQYFVWAIPDPRYSQRFLLTETHTVARVMQEDRGQGQWATAGIKYNNLQLPST